MATAEEEKNSYYYVNGQRVPLVREPSVYAVKFARGEKSDSPALSRRFSRLLRDESENIFFVPNYGLQIYRATPQVSRTEAEQKHNIENLSRSVAELNKESAVEYAALAFRRTADGSELMYVTNRFIVQFKPDVTQQQIDDLNSKFGVTRLEELGFCENGYLLQAPEGSGERSAVALANAYYESGLCLFANPDFVRKTHFRHATSRLRVYELARDLGISNESLIDILHDLHVDVKSHMSMVEDEIRAEVYRQLREGGHLQGSTERAAIGAPTQAAYTEREVAERTQYLSEQWHLVTAKVTDAWSGVTRGSSSIKICVMDDGIDVDHLEFSGKVTRQYDFAAHVDNARPKTADDNHGTACAGVATARGQKAIGAAPDCSLIAIRTPGFLGIADEAQMFRRAVEWDADIISCSWGPTDGRGTSDLLPDSTRTAINYCVTQGRGGKGIPIFWASGNGNESVSLDGYAANPDVIAVAASTSNETRAWYSDFGPEIWVCAPSSGDSALGERRIFTVDRTGNAGYNTGNASLGDASGDYTNNFGGTSSATPLVAGIAGLMLSTSSELTHRQVRNILKDTADRIGGSSSYNSSGHSNEYGYGRVNALAAAQRARELSTGGSSTTPSTGTRPSITGPSTHPRTSGAPTFQINPGGNSYYAVEVATRADLFDQAGHGSERNQSNFYGSWQDTALMNGTSYILPTTVWNRIKTADRLYFRIFTSASSSDWVNYEVSTPYSQATSAPSLQITGASSSIGTTPSTEAPTISGPAILNRGAVAPTFQIGIGGNTYYAVEVATRSDLFDQNGHGGERRSSNFYGSWSDTALMNSPTYRLPTPVWDRLKSASRLYYRVFTSADSASWVNFAVSTPDSQAASTPSLQITDATTDTTPSIGAGLSITGPSTYDRASSPPTFQVNTGRNRYYSVEVATRANLFDQNGHGSERNSTNFYGSWSDTALMSATTYTLSTSAWDQLKNSDRLYYRLYTSSSQTDWVDFEVSTPDSQASSAPSVQLTGVALRTVSSKSSKRMVADNQIAVIGPETYERGAIAPSFSISTGGNRYYAVEVATEPRLLCSHYAGQRNEDNFFASWQRGVTESNGDTIYTMPSDAWQRLRSAERLFYRVLTTAEPNVWSNYGYSTSDEAYNEAPWINLRGGAAAKTDPTSPDIELPRYTTDRSDDERLWREQV